MRKFVTFFVAGCLLSVAAAASATVWTDSKVFSTGNVLTQTGTFKWDHAVTADFQIPYDTVNSASLEIVSRRAVDNNDIVSIVNLANFIELGHLKATGNSPVTTTFDLAGTQVFASWQSGDTLKLALDYNAGNIPNQSLTMVSSLFTLNYTNAEAPAPVPEPGTMVLLGCGMLGVAVFSKRRNNSAA